MKIVTVLGARPQFVKAAPTSRELRRRHDEIIIHTGQHYDANMSDIFFDELGIPQPDVHLGGGGGSHADQTAKMLVGVEKLRLSEKPDWVPIYGDTNGTVSAALAAAKVHVPIAHVEAGLRSFNRQMPEEVNRVVADHLSSLLLCPSQTAADNLAKEGIIAGVEVVGDVMADALLMAASGSSDVVRRLGLEPGAYALATVHRAENTDDPKRLGGIVTAFAAMDRPVLLPLHPRTRDALDKAGLSLPSNVVACDPLGYIDMVTALRNAALVLTDSGGLQKEAYWLKVPCVTLRDETEWVETLETGWNRLAGADPCAILDATKSAVRLDEHAVLYGGDGRAVARVVEALEKERPL
ncbi:non-hydrolyzing UDP-N-acetylglucosamine 2-epimerase [Methylosinus sp. PW1]|uniref:non-hydrolyzing UDP-N-acetylglucosamine 2-epimerase n=1 Tax=Methylosinus sp. PW1 TaxID=107636 RepID=UPI000566081C|nr:UDP-N-acetylglucosamine 2-epimerase (non-hydrolyzing) [Methylosinus sp. PW1]